MRVITIDPEKMKTENAAAACVLALGFFDGVHRGHQHVIATARREANRLHLPLAVMTFDRHVSQVFPMPKSAGFRYLTSVAEKAALMADQGVDTLYVVTFTKQFAGLTPQVFTDRFLIGLGAQVVVAGFDYTFGRGGKATVADLPQYSRGAFTVITVDQLQAEARKISSTRIRELIATGQVEQANVLLGHPYRLNVRPCIQQGSRLQVLPQLDRQQLPPAGDYTVQLTTHRGQCSAVLEVNAAGTLTLQTVRPLGACTEMSVTIVKRLVAVVRRRAPRAVNFA